MGRARGRRSDTYRILHSATRWHGACIVRGMNSTPYTQIGRSPYYSALSADELRKLRHACKVAQLPFVAMACQPVPARQLIGEVARREAQK